MRVELILSKSIEEYNSLDLLIIIIKSSSLSSRTLFSWLKKLEKS